MLRNVPPGCSCETLVKNCSEKGEQVLYAIPPKIIRGMHCALVRMAGIEDAERVCRRLNQFKVAESKHLKVHLHPRCNLRRVNKEKSHHIIFSDPQYALKMSIIAQVQQSERILRQGRERQLRSREHLARFDGVLLSPRTWQRLLEGRRATEGRAHAH